MVSSVARVASAFIVGAALVLVASPASAHFDLTAPASWSVDDQADGTPEKLGPCGNEGTPMLALDDAGKPVITAVKEGDMVTVTIKEVVFHPGHYRISLSTDWSDAGDTVQGGFPADPMVTMGKTNSGTMLCPGAGAGSQPCGSVPIEQQTPVQVPGVGWILADDVFEHCDPFTGPQTIKIALPPGVTCTECALQVLEFMSDHGLNVPGGCFYHHCANLSIAGETVPIEAGTESGASSGAASGASSGEASGAVGATSGVSAQTGSSEPSGSAVSSGSASTSGAGTTTGTTVSSTSGSASGTASGSASPPPATTATSPSSGGCSVSPRQVSFGAGLAGLALGAVLLRRRRR
jgi:hypothetical protein